MPNYLFNVDFVVLYPLVIFLVVARQSSARGSGGDQLIEMLGIESPF
jgi:hypothetical protein